MVSEIGFCSVFYSRSQNQLRRGWWWTLASTGAAWRQWQKGSRPCSSCYLPR